MTAYKFTKAEQKRLLKSGLWMIRFFDNGNGHGDFKWKPVGQWTVCPNWTGDSEENPSCENGGLFGQSPKAGGYCKHGSRMELCETKKQIVVGGDKVKTGAARIVALNENIPPVFIERVGGYLDLRGYAHPLPAGLTVKGTVYK